MGKRVPGERDLALPVHCWGSWTCHSPSLGPFRPVRDKLPPPLKFPRRHLLALFPTCFSGNGQGFLALNLEDTGHKFAIVDGHPYPRWGWTCSVSSSGSRAQPTYDMRMRPYMLPAAFAFAMQLGEAWVADCPLGPLQASHPHSGLPSHLGNSITLVHPEPLCTQLYVALRKGPEERVT